MILALFGMMIKVRKMKTFKTMIKTHRRKMKTYKTRIRIRRRKI